MNALARGIRKAVSQDRHRFVEGNYDLDLSYISPNIIAMAIPGSGIETYWRNDIDSVVSMLNEYHADKYMIWNLSELTYNYDKFDNRVIEMGFPDHHNPPLDMLFEIIVTMDRWMTADPDHVAVVHCKGGKGRTGTVIACYLLFSGSIDEPYAALELFAEKRSAKKKGVTGISQLRYVSYFGAVLNAKKKPIPRKFRLVRLVMKTVPNFKSGGKGGCRPYLRIFKGTVPMVPLFTREQQQPVLYLPDHPHPITWEFNDLYAEGDLLIQCRHVNKDGSAEKVVYRTALHTAFLEPGVLTMGMNELDDVQKNKSRFKESFQIELHFEDVFSSQQGTTSGSTDGFSFNSNSIDQTEEMDEKTAFYMQAFERSPARKIRFQHNYIKKGMTPSQIDFRKASPHLSRPKVEGSGSFPITVTPPNLNSDDISEALKKLNKKTSQDPQTRPRAVSPTLRSSSFQTQPATRPSSSLTNSRLHTSSTSLAHSAPEPPALPPEPSLISTLPERSGGESGWIGSNSRKTERALTNSAMSVPSKRNERAALTNSAMAAPSRNPPLPVRSISPPVVSPSRPTPFNKAASSSELVSMSKQDQAGKYSLGSYRSNSTSVNSSPPRPRPISPLVRCSTSTSFRPASPTQARRAPSSSSFPQTQAVSPPLRSMKRPPNTQLTSPILPPRSTSPHASHRPTSPSIPPLRTISPLQPGQERSGPSPRPNPLFPSRSMSTFSSHAPAYPALPPKHHSSRPVTNAAPPAPSAPAPMPPPLPPPLPPSIPPPSLPTEQ